MKKKFKKNLEKKLRIPFKFEIMDKVNRYSHIRNIAEASPGIGGNTSVANRVQNLAHFCF
jgi:hypothetical protein